VGSIEQLKSVFNDSWDWSTAGEEWSTWWGGTPALWFGALLPRVHGFLPAGTVLEIAPGFGRWTQYLKDLADDLFVVDLAEKCIEACRTRFADAGNISFHVNDGRSLAMVRDESIDFAFSWDSLVHADADVLEAYLAQMAKKLTPNGVGFFHHSNAAAYPWLGALAVKVPERLRRPLVKRGALLDVYAWRATDVDAKGVEAMCVKHGLVCISQEVFTWEHGPYLTEAITVFTRSGSTWARPNRVVRNRTFRKDAQRMVKLYVSA
jgi:SAM-dependent methyltransferase